MKLGQEGEPAFGFVHSFAIPAVAGVFAAAVAHPVDLFVVASQTGQKAQTMLALRKQPVRTLSRGIWPSLLQAVIVYPFMFGTYDYARSRGNSIAVSGVAAALPETAVKGPLESIKNLQQMVVPVTARAIARGTALMGAREGRSCLVSLALTRAPNSRSSFLSMLQAQATYSTLASTSSQEPTSPPPPLPRGSVQGASRACGSTPSTQCERRPSSAKSCQS